MQLFTGVLLHEAENEEYLTHHDHYKCKTTFSQQQYWKGRADSNVIVSILCLPGLKNQGTHTFNAYEKPCFKSVSYKCLEN
jgi:hypothetical protein